MKNPTVVLLCGPGVRGLEHCPPMYHFDVDGEQHAAFLAAPVETLKEWGIPGPLTQIVHVRPTERWDNENQQWVKPSAEAKPTFCYVKNSDGGVFIHIH